MRAVVGVLFWFSIGLLALNALYVSVGENRLWLGLLVPVALALFGAWWPGLGYSGMALVAFGVYPALLITRAVLLQVFSSDWSCSTVGFDGISNPNGGIAIGMSAGCTTISIDLILFGLLLWATALLGAALIRSQPRRAHTPEQYPPKRVRGDLYTKPPAFSHCSSADRPWPPLVASIGAPAKTDT